MIDPLDFRVLHTLRCMGFSGEDRVGRAGDFTTGEALVALRRLADRGLVENSGGPFSGWGVTEAGRARDLELVADELAESGAETRVRECYQTFLGLNPELLQVSSDWQMRKVGSSFMVNDHSDAEYDAGVLDRVWKLDDAIQPVCVELVHALDRFTPYASRFSHALERAAMGEIEYVADNLESYHMVWAQLHQDLLITLRISREDERSGSS